MASRWKPGIGQRLGMPQGDQRDRAVRFGNVWSEPNARCAKIAPDSGSARRLTATCLHVGVPAH
jgi:hypothetical protein